MYESPSRRAVVEIAWRSVPALGSERQMPARGSPFASLGRKRCFWSSVPYCASTSHSTRCVPRMPARPIHPRDSSSKTIAKVV